jgi:3-methyl-2-oxobutanoate hydroxymethyltransferase
LEDRIKQKKDHEKIVMLTAYDYQTAKILNETSIDMILVGDSLGMVFQGYKDTKSVQIEDMIYHTKAVAKGAQKKPVIGDMPFHSDDSPEIALKNAKRFLDVGAKGVKIEGAKFETIRVLTDDKIPVMGHLGLLPQTANTYKVHGKNPEEATQMVKDALELERCGVFSMILECIPEMLSKRITKSIHVPTIGIGAGKFCDGQILVINDMLGYDEEFTPKYLKRYLHINKQITKAVKTFSVDVRAGKYPDDEHTYH